MTDADAFLAAIEAAPHDPTPRLVFADWLDEHGEADYAAYIRLAVQIDLREATPPDVRRRLRAERHALFERVRAGWAERFPPLVRSLDMFRGTPTARLALTAAEFTSWAGPWPVFACRRVLLYQCYGAEAALGGCDQLRHVAAVEFDDYQPIGPASDPLLAALSASPHLTALHTLQFRTLAPSRGGLERFADSPLADRLARFAFRYEINPIYHDWADVDARQPPAGAIRDTLAAFLGEYGHLLPD